MYGLDKTKINNVFIKHIDVDKLLSNDNVTFIKAKPNSKKSTLIPTDKDASELISIEYIAIKDNDVFDVFRLGHKDNEGFIVPYCKIELTVHDKTDNNLIPLSISDYKNRLMRIGRYLKNRYGLTVSFKNVIFSMMEINITQQMNYKFDDYYHILTLMQELASKDYHKSKPNYKNKDNFFTGLTLSNNSTEIKIYDKTKQLYNEYKVIVDDRYMRIEYKLKDAQRIARAFGTNKLHEITDQQILEFLQQHIQIDLIDPIEKKHIPMSNKQLEKLFKTIKKNNKHKFIPIFVATAHGELCDNKKCSSLPLLFDIEQLITIVSSYDTKHKKRNIKLIKDNSNIVKFHNNFDKLEEIKLKFTKEGGDRL